MFESAIASYVAETHTMLNSLDLKSVEALMLKLIRTRDEGGRIFIMGNGGSAATASHFVTDFNKGVSEHLRKRFMFVCLNDNTPSVMAIANDIGFDEIFRFQLKNYLSKKDLVIGISGSGNSRNVVNAIAYAKELGAPTAGLVGYDGGRVAKEADLVVHIPVANMQHVEDMHMILDHLMMSILREHLESVDGNNADSPTH